MSNSKIFQLFRAYLRKFLLIIAIYSLLLHSSEISAQSFSNNITCSFNPAPDEELFFCGSQVTATINIVNLDPTYSDLHFLFPTQFQLVSINGVAPTVSPLVEQLTVNDLNPTPTVYNMQHSSFSLQNPTTYVIIFNVLPCLNGDDVSDEGALFEMYVLNGNGGRIDAIFNQQIIQGGNGFTHFTSFSNNSAVLTAITPVPQFTVPGITYYNEFDLYLDAVGGIQNISITIVQEADATNDGLEIQLNSGSSIELQPFSSGGGTYVYVLDQAFISSNSRVMFNVRL